MNHLKIKTVAGKDWPAWTKDLRTAGCAEAIVVEQATDADLPVVGLLVDLGLGQEKVLLTLTGRLVNAVAAVVRGANLRNHGVEEP